MEIFNSYGFIIFASCIIILSYLFSIISKRTNIPSVLMLIATGFGVQQLLHLLGRQTPNLFGTLEILGIIGLTMIVLEASLDLELKKEKLPIILRSSIVAILGLAASSVAAAAIIYYLTEATFGIALLYGVPMSILSSAIIIPSIGNLSEEKKEHLIYESTISDIVGIMAFYYLISGLEARPGENLFLSITGNLLLTVFVSLFFSYLLVFVFQKINTHIKLFLLIAVLLLLYATGKQLHISSLLIILVFGLVLNNHHIFFDNFMGKWINPRAIHRMLNEFRLITAESTFVVRTFFFVVFGITISISSLFSFKVVLISGLIILSIYFIRLIILKIFMKDVMPTLYVAPRGLITILLFFAIPKKLQIADFESGILLFIILVTSVIMMFTLIQHKPKPETREAENSQARNDEMSHQNLTIDPVNPEDIHS